MYGLVRIEVTLIKTITFLIYKDTGVYHGIQRKVIGF